MLDFREEIALNSCGNCHCEIPEGSAACPRCGTEAPRGLLASLGSLFRRKRPEPGATPAATPPRSPADSGTSTASFAFEVEDVFTITGRGMVATGRVIRGQIAKGDEISFRSPKGEVIRRRIVGIETVGKIVDSAKEGETVGLLFTKPVAFDVLVRGVVFERV
jgi:hypothetical protein